MRVLSVRVLAREVKTLEEVKPRRATCPVDSKPVFRMAAPYKA
jgi:hypothetical protein